MDVEPVISSGKTAGKSGDSVVVLEFAQDAIMRSEKPNDTVDAPKLRLGLRESQPTAGQLFGEQTTSVCGKSSVDISPFARGMRANLAGNASLGNDLESSVTCSAQKS